MNWEILFAFLIGMTILAASPGPGVLASVSKALAEGFKSSLFLIGGLVLGDTIFLVLALMGMSAISKIMGELFFIIKIIGGLYLIYLGIRMVKKNSIQINSKLSRKQSRFKTFLSGFLVTMGNPKPILFYASVVPTIIDIHSVSIFEVLALISIIVAVSFIVIGTYCYFASLSRKFVKNESFNRKISVVSAFTMIGAGALVLVKK